MKTDTTTSDQIKQFIADYFNAKLLVEQMAWQEFESYKKRMPPPVEAPLVVYRREVFSKFCEGQTSAFSSYSARGPHDEEFDYTKWDLTGIKQTGEFWIVEHENMRGKMKCITLGKLYQHKIRQLPDGSFRIVAERSKNMREQKTWDNCPL